MTRFSFDLVRKLKSPFCLTGRSLTLILLLLTSTVPLRPETPNTGPPSVLPASKVRSLIQQIPEYTSFSYSGMAFFKGKLYVTTNIGLLELERGRISKVYRVQKQYSVVSGPWFDGADELLWMVDDQTHELLSFDGTNWRRVPMTWPEKGFYTRGEVFEGVKAVGNAHGFWMVAASNVWRWDAASKRWRGEPSPQKTVGDDIIGALPVEGKLLFLVRHQRWGRLLVRPGGEFKSDSVSLFDGNWRDIPNRGGRFLAEQWVVARDAGYIRSDDGTLLQVTTRGITKVDAPGKCEALTISSAGILLASIRVKGIYEHTGQWKLRASSPYTSGSGDYWGYLAEGAGELAYAVTAKPVMDKEHSGERNVKWIKNAPTTLWVAATGANFQEVSP
jgi:hypothetical protein